jgi:predicted SAM-dependent methyltransferase
MKENKYNYLNLGCGERYHAAWINIDIRAKNKNVIEYNILKGIPFPNDTFDVVYHSHLLEHLTLVDGKNFLKECYRVLKPKGILRIVVPDLERIIKEYIKIISTENGETINDERHNWILLELYDQTTRNQSGGEMKEFILSGRETEYIMERIGAEGAAIINNKDRKLFKQVTKLKNIVFGFINKIPFIRYYQIGKFRSSGEIHKNMYDKYSLRKLLKEIGFREIYVQNAETSLIDSWDQFKLDSINGLTLKPDSLFIEARK